MLLLFDISNWQTKSTLPVFKPLVIAYFAQFLKRSGEKTFSIKDGDTDDSVSIENIKMKLKSVSINSVVEDNLQVNLDNSCAK